MSIAIILHSLAATIWVGGMFFAYMALRPVAASVLEAPERLCLWAEVFKRFFRWVWASIAVLLGSGLWMIVFGFGGMKAAGLHVHLMLTIALLMIALFIYINVSPVKLLNTAVSSKNWPEGAENLAKIRRIIAINLCLGLIVIAIGSGGRFLV